MNAIHNPRTDRVAPLPMARVAPIDPLFRMALYTDEDNDNLHAAHVSIRRDVLEVRSSTSGEIFFQCACCKHLPRSERAPRSTVAPIRVEQIYRAAVRFMVEHVPKCEHIPRTIKLMMKPNKAAGRVAGAGSRDYWARSARAIGLANGDDGHIIWSPGAANYASNVTY